MSTEVAVRKHKVTLRGYPITGFPDGDQIHLKRPVEIHYRAIDNKTMTPDLSPVDPGVYYTAPQLEEMGYDKPPTKGWYRRRYPRTDLTGVNYRSWVCEANSPYEAQDKFEKQFKVIPNRANLDIVEVDEDTPLGPCDPCKIRPTID